jgi:diaminohydroxyphosphoribosylaminopyrimidine deaminase/5-amino-6-(5-phosphoribosylamino)uracil reductase
MRSALRLAARGLGRTSPNPMVGAIIVKAGKILGRGYHRRAGLAHAEIEAIQDARRRGHDLRGSALYVTLEPCCTHGRTPPCTDAIIAARVKRVIVAATDPNPDHSGRGFTVLRRAGIEIIHGVLARESSRLNESFEHWMVHRTPFVTVKSGMTLDGKIATSTGESKWITSEQSRALAMALRQRHDAILVGINTVLADNPSLTLRSVAGRRPDARTVEPRRRIILDSQARTPLHARVVTDSMVESTTIIVSNTAPVRRVAALRKRVRVEVAPLKHGAMDLRWLLEKLGEQNVTSLLVEGGGEVNASFLFSRLAHRVVFFYAPKILCGRDARKAVAGLGVSDLQRAIRLCDVEYRPVGPDLLLSARIEN